MSDSPVTVYTAPDCPHCAAAKAYLSERGVDFLEIDVRQKPGSLRRLLVLAGRAVVPTVHARGQVAIGFDPGRIDELLLELQKPEAEPDFSWPEPRAEGEAEPSDEVER